MLPASLVDEAVEGLVTRPAGEPGPVALREQPAEPPLGGVGGQEHEPGQHGEHEARQGHRRLAELPGHQQIRDEDQRDQLDAGRDARAEALPPAALVGVGLAQIPHDQGQQDQVDLAEVNGPQHRLGPQDRPRGQQRRAGPDREPAVAEAAEGEPHRRQQRHQVHGHGQLEGQLVRDERDERERDGRERRVGERQVEIAVPGPVVQRRRQVRVVVRPDVPDDEPAGPVHGQVDRVHGVGLRVADHIDHVAAERYAEHGQAGQQQPAAGRAIVPGR